MSPRHARSSPKRDELPAIVTMRVSVDTREGLGGQIARFGPNPFGGRFLRAICVVTNEGKGRRPLPSFAPSISSRKNSAAHGADLFSGS